MDDTTAVGGVTKSQSPFVWRCAACGYETTLNPYRSDDGLIVCDCPSCGRYHWQRVTVAGSSGDVDANGDVVGERPELLVWLTARLRFWIVASWLPEARS